MTVGSSSIPQVPRQLLERFVAVARLDGSAVPRTILFVTDPDAVRRPEGIAGWRAADQPAHVRVLRDLPDTPGPMLIRVDGTSPAGGRVIGTDVTLGVDRHDAELTAAVLTRHVGITALVIRPADDRPAAHVTLWERGRGMLRVTGNGRRPAYVSMDTIDEPPLRSLLRDASWVEVCQVLRDDLLPSPESLPLLAFEQELAALLDATRIERREITDPAGVTLLATVLTGVPVHRAPGREAAVAVTADRRLGVVAAGALARDGDVRRASTPSMHARPLLVELARLLRGEHALLDAAAPHTTLAFVVADTIDSATGAAFAQHRLLIEPDDAPTIAEALNGPGTTVIALDAERVIADSVELFVDREYPELTAAHLTTSGAAFAILVCRRFVTETGEPRLHITMWRGGRGSVLLAWPRELQFRPMHSLIDDETVVRRLMSRTGWFDLRELICARYKPSRAQLRLILVQQLAALHRCDAVERKVVMGPDGEPVWATAVTGVRVIPPTWPRHANEPWWTPVTVLVTDDDNVKVVRSDDPQSLR